MVCTDSSILTLSAKAGMVSNEANQCCRVDTNMGFQMTKFEFGSRLSYLQAVDPMSSFTSLNLSL